MNESCIVTTTFCRKCFKLRSCLKTNNVSGYMYLCKECANEQDLVSNCRSCGKEGIAKELNKNGGYCHLCMNDNIIECELCGSETYSHKANNGICNKCSSGENKSCIKCGSYVNYKKMSSDGLCEKCSIKIYKQLKESGVNEIVECIECGREQLVNDLNNGLCIYCYSESLEKDIQRIKNKIKYKKVYSR